MSPDDSSPPPPQQVVLVFGVQNVACMPFAGIGATNQLASRASKIAANMMIMGDDSTRTRRRRKSTTTTTTTSDIIAKNDPKEVHDGDDHNNVNAIAAAADSGLPPPLRLPDILAVQELFEKGNSQAYDAFVNQIQKKGTVVGTPTQNSGLVTLLLSEKCRLAEGFTPHFEPFKVTGPESCILRKGCQTMIVEMVDDGSLVVVVNAHMQSDLWFDGQRARISQYETVGRELARARRWCTHDAPAAYRHQHRFAGAFVLGDLQAHAGSEEYKKMLEILKKTSSCVTILDGTSGLGDAYPIGKGFDRQHNAFTRSTPNMRSDYVLAFHWMSDSSSSSSTGIRSNVGIQTSSLTTSWILTPHDQEEEEGHEDEEESGVILSDHLGVEVAFVL